MTLCTGEQWPAARGCSAINGHQGLNEGLRRFILAATTAEASHQHADERGRLRCWGREGPLGQRHADDGVVTALQVHVNLHAPQTSICGQAPMLRTIQICTHIAQHIKIGLTCPSNCCAKRWQMQMCIIEVITRKRRNHIREALASAQLNGNILEAEHECFCWTAGLTGVTCWTAQMSTLIIPHADLHQYSSHVVSHCMATPYQLTVSKNQQENSLCALLL